MANSNFGVAKKKSNAGAKFGTFLLLAVIAAVGGGGYYFYTNDPELLRHLTERDQFAVPAAYVLAHKGVPKEAIAPLRKGLEEGTPEVRAAYVRTLGLAHDRANSAFIAHAATKDDDFAVRVAATTALGENGDVTVHRTVELTLEDADDRVKIAAAHTVGKLKLDRYIPDLIGFLSHHNADLQRAAKEELDGFVGEGRSFGFRPEEWSKWYEGEYD